MKRIISVLGLLIAGVGVVCGLVAYFIPAGIFFSRGDGFLGFIQLFFPPAAIVLPWIIDPLYGIAAVASLPLVALGVVMADLEER